MEMVVLISDDSNAIYVGQSAELLLLLLLLGYSRLVYGDANATKKFRETRM